MRFAYAILISHAALTLSAATNQIKVDQAGYLSDAPKLAMVVRDVDGSARSAGFTVRSADDFSAVFTGTLSEPALAPDSGDNVQIADFSPLSKTGKFYIEIPAVGRSWTFSIGPNVFNRVYYLAMRAFYGQRCGTSVDLGSEYPRYKHGVCHAAGAYHPSTGMEGAHPSAKGWHDAGDYGRYVVSSGITTATLLWAWELYGDRIRNTSLHIPESGESTPDILGEVRWNLDWMMSMQDADGGVFHKQTSAAFCGFVMPEKDSLVSYVIGAGHQPFKTSCATADLASVAAIAARAFRPFDQAYADKCLRAAQNAWKWLNANPNVVFHNPAGVSTGEYGDEHCEDELLWAAAELWRTTGDGQYGKYFLGHFRGLLNALREPPSWSGVGSLALWTYAMGPAGDQDAIQLIRTQSLKAADEILQRASAHPYRISLTTKDYVWGSNGVAANYSMQLLVADELQPNPKYRHAALDNVHYILGRNLFSLSWVTQVGEHAFVHPHHRQSIADGIDLPWPGLMSGGPNAKREDEVMKQRLTASAPPGRCYVDDAEAYACNEVAINWNAPLVFSLAAFVER